MKYFLLLFAFPALLSAQIKFCNYEYYIVSDKDSLAIINLEKKQVLIQERITETYDAVGTLKQKMAETKHTKEMQKILSKIDKKKKLNKKEIPLSDKYNQMLANISELANNIVQDSILLYNYQTASTLITNNGIHRFPSGIHTYLDKNSSLKKVLVNEGLYDFNNIILFEFEKKSRQYKDLCFCESSDNSEINIFITKQREYKNGKLIMELNFEKEDCIYEMTTYKDNNKNGPYIAYQGYFDDEENNMNYTIKAKGEYINGEKHGEWYEQEKRYDQRYDFYTFHHTTKVTYDHGIKEGKEIFYDDEIYRETTYLNGKKHGEELIYKCESDYLCEKYPNRARGVLIEINNYKNGEYDGEQKKWCENGKNRTYYNIVDGRKIEKKEWWCDGKLVWHEKQATENQTGFLKIWDEKGKLRFSSKTIFLDSKLEYSNIYTKTDIVIWFSNGKKAAEFSTRFDGDVHWFSGEQRAWFYSGSKLLDVDFDYDEDLIAGKVYWRNGKTRTNCIKTSYLNQGERYYETECRCFDNDGREYAPYDCEDGSPEMRPIGNEYNFKGLLEKNLPLEYLEYVDPLEYRG